MTDLESQLTEALDLAQAANDDCRVLLARAERAESVIAEALGVVRSGSVPIGVPVARHYDRLLAEAVRVLAGYEKDGANND